MFSAPMRRGLLCQRFPLTISPLIDFKSPGSDLGSYEFCTEVSLAAVESFDEAFDELRRVPLRNITNIWALVNSTIGCNGALETDSDFRLDSKMASYDGSSAFGDPNYFSPETEVNTPNSYCTPTPYFVQTMQSPVESDLTLTNTNYSFASDITVHSPNGVYDEIATSFAFSPEPKVQLPSSGPFKCSPTFPSQQKQTLNATSSFSNISFSPGPEKRGDFGRQAWPKSVSPYASSPHHPGPTNLPNQLFDVPEGSRFFVIKSYSADDVDASLKHGLWTLTDLGNKRLNKAFNEARAAGSGKIYLFFLVNGSGKFCGCCEMLDEVDFTRAVDIWVEVLRWRGVFPVGWLMMKDIPNRAFSHLRVPANEYKSVANSRDTQEVPFEVGLSMMRLFLTV